MPTKKLEARGSWRAKGRTGEPEALGLPQRPDWLDEAATKFWQHIVPLLVKQQCAAEIDGSQIAKLCDFWSVFLRTRDLRECADPGTPEWKRLYDACNTASNEIDKLSQRFGLTPADRAGIKIQDASPIKTDAAMFFSENGN